MLRRSEVTRWRILVGVSLLDLPSARGLSVPAKIFLHPSSFILGALHFRSRFVEVVFQFDGGVANRVPSFFFGLPNGVASLRPGLPRGLAGFLCHLPRLFPRFSSRLPGFFSIRACRQRQGGHYAQNNEEFTAHDGSLAIGTSDILKKFGAWLSLVERLVRDQEAGGSNPLAPTIAIINLEK